MIRILLTVSVVLAAAPAVAENFYGAIAYSVKDEKLGTSWNYKSESGAEKRALEECVKKGGTKCRIAVKVTNSCGAFAASKGARSLKETGVSWGYNNHEDAKARAIKECKARSSDGGCTIKTSTCNFGK